MKPLLLLVIFIGTTSCAKAIYVKEVNCMNSATHNWVLVDGEFSCEKANNECELGFIQEASLEEDCVKNPACSFEPNKCYCRVYEGHQCICAGGPPQKCILKSDEAV